jgi:citrate synthase
MIVNIDCIINQCYRSSMVTWLTSADASERLAVNRATLYAYVSRGLIRSSPAPGDPRARRYAAEDVERLRSRAEQRRDPQKAVERALHWGVPVLESAITLIAADRLYYRGHDACALARSKSIKQVASLIWLGSFDGDVRASDVHVVPGKSGDRRPFIARAQSMLPLVAGRDPLALDLRPRPVAQSGWRILHLLAGVAVGSSQLEATIDQTLCRHWAPRAPHGPDLLRAALIVCADHELNVSSFTARCVASAGANPYSVVLAGLAAIEGPKHGGMTARIETMTDELRRAPDIKRALADRLRRGEPLYGFGHPLYPNGDPRAQLLLDLLQKRHAQSSEVKMAREIAGAGEEILGGDKPTIDFALVTLARALKLPEGAALTLFALGRSIGWIGHAIEQYGRDEIIRPRARYVGTMP